jgi:FlaG/FlaF family flagellin (archaellin)
VHLRRALLLFAIVLGVAALAASFSRSGNSGDPLAPPDPTQTQTQTQTESETAPSAAPGDSPVSTDATPVTLEFDAAEDQTRRLERGVAANIEVSVDAPGLVSIPLLGVSAPAEPITPARFDLLVSQAGTYPVVFTPAQGDEEREVGTLEVSAPSE